MSITLTCTWNPRGEASRFINIYPHLIAAYKEVYVILPPTADQTQIEILQPLDRVNLQISSDWSWGRYLALKQTQKTPAPFIHYADLDRLIRWIETRLQEWQEAVEQIQHHDCLVIGRTEKAWDTHPQALRQTENISNQLFSFLLGKNLDISAGSKGFSRVAVDFILKNSQPGRALGTDAEWIVLAKRGGFTIESLLVNGLDWESADRYRLSAASNESQRVTALAYDAVAENWALRVQVAAEIVACGLDAWQRQLKS
jgi:hypothetical protein